MRRIEALILLTCFCTTLASAWTPPDSPTAQAPSGPLFVPADRCIACHNDLSTPAGEDVSIGNHWRAGMMANASRDPYWQAAVRREILDFPGAKAAIENECSACHMPMTRFEANASGQKGAVFAHLPIGRLNARADTLAADGVSCTLCHQILPDNLGREESFTAGHRVDTETSPGQRRIFGPYQVDPGRERLMNSSSDFRPSRASHLHTSEACATCHTLYTHALNAEGESIGRLPEQVPYLEWKHSGYRETHSCQACHMPVVQGEMPITSVMGQPREAFSRHSFLGGNAFMLKTLNRFRTELGVTALPQEFDRGAANTEAHLKESSARVSIETASLNGRQLTVDVSVENLAGHKLPTAYPSRRSWLHLTVKGPDDRVIFESGAVTREGAISGNDNDSNATQFEPHYGTISKSDQVQIFEAILAGPDGQVTTGLLTAVRYAKDNRILPRGFDKGSAHDDIKVKGEAATDADFTAGGDRVRYEVGVGEQAVGPWKVEVELLYQPVGYRWANNLGKVEAFETKRFVRYYESMAPAGTVRLAGASTVVP